MKTYKKTDDYTLVGTAERHTQISNTLLSTMAKPTILARPDCTWNHPNEKYNNAIIFSNGNSKVNRLGKVLGKKTFAYGKSTILSCPNATGCVRFCYQNLNNYSASMRLHGHNYYQIYSKKTDDIVDTIENGLSLLNNPEVVRLNDNGDFVSKFEILAYAHVATNHPEIVFYGYTKNTPHLYQARAEFGQFPSNLRIAISDLNVNDVTMEKYMRLILSDFPGEFRVCHIIDTPERDDLYQSLPWNNEEFQAYNYTSDFKIALHVGVAQRQFCSEEELQVNDKYSSGSDTDGTKFC